MSDNTPLSIKKQSPSPCYFGFWRGIQDSTDGRTSIVDGSGKNRPLLMAPNATYSNVVGTNAGYCTIIGAASPTNRSIGAADTFVWDLFAGQSMLLALTMIAAIPAANAHLFNARGAAGDVKGLSVVIDTAGKPVVFVRDTGTTFATTAPTEAAADGTSRQIIVGIDGTTKKVFIWRGGVAVSNSGQTITSTAGSTQSDDPPRFGIADPVSNPTWDGAANLQIRDMHLLSMPYWPANISSVVAELVRNPHRPLSARLLPAAASA